jgi:hypothetical protein
MSFGKRENKRPLLFVIGSAPCCKEDLDRLKAMFPEDQKVSADLMAIGLDVFKNPAPWAYVASGEIGDITFIQEYKKLHGQRGCKVISYEPFPGVDIVLNRIFWEGGSSALLGCLAGIRRGYEKIVLIGCPMQGANPNHPGADYSMFQAKWIEEKGQLSKVRSMSGFTMELLGEPTKEWMGCV